jgi:hypothetical protein
MELTRSLELAGDLSQVLIFIFSMIAQLAEIVSAIHAAGRVRRRASPNWSADRAQLPHGKPDL